MQSKEKERLKKRCELIEKVVKTVRGDVVRRSSTVCQKSVGKGPDACSCDLGFFNICPRPVKALLLTRLTLSLVSTSRFILFERTCFLWLGSGTFEFLCSSGLLSIAFPNSDVDVETRLRFVVDTLPRTEYRLWNLPLELKLLGEGGCSGEAGGASVL
jgi:hypothetical protein